MRSYEDVDWDTFWRWEIFRRELDPIDPFRWKADSSRELRNLPQGRDREGIAPRILDSSCGLGCHAMVQQSLGFRVEACDNSLLVLERARRSMSEHAMAIPTFQAVWETLGASHARRYDLIFNDEIHQVRPRRELLAALRGFHGALRPGGSFVFFYADASKPDNGPGHAQWDWQHVHRDRTAWTARADGLEVSLDIHPERADETLVIELHTYRIRQEGSSERIESMTMARNYLWDWAHVIPVLEEAGFARFESHRFVNVHGNGYSMNLATRD